MRGVFEEINVIDDSESSISWSPDRLGVILALLGVDSSITTVVSVSSPGDIDVIDTSGGDKRSCGEYDVVDFIEFTGWTIFNAWAVMFLDEVASGRKCWSTLCCLYRVLVEVAVDGTSVSGVSSTEILLKDIESSLDNVFEETAWDPYPLKSKSNSSTYNYIYIFNSIFYCNTGIKYYAP